MKNYLPLIYLLIGIVVGGIVGIFCPAAVPYLAPVGQIFMNLLFMLVVPMVFFSVASSVGDLSGSGKAGKVLKKSVGVYMVLALVLAVISYIAVLLYMPWLGDCLSVTDGLQTGETGMADAERESLGSLIVNSLTVRDFSELFATQHILPVMIVALLLGLSTAHAGEAGKRVQEGMRSLNIVVMQVMDILMQLAPIGLGCYFAEVAQQMGNQILGGYLHITLLYIYLTIAVYCVLNPLMVLVTAGWPGLKTYLRAIVRPSLMAVTTLSSSATIPSNIEACKQMGIQDDIAQSVIPLGTNLFKGGSVISCVLKVCFLMLLIGMPMTGASTICLIIGLSLVASMVVGAIPTGAGTAELLICSLLGADPAYVGILMIISTLVDMPGTLLNTNNNTLAAVVINKRLK